MPKKNKIALNAWTVNEEDDMEWFLKNDFDFITTNEPELLLKISSQPENSTSMKNLVTTSTLSRSFLSCIYN
ncbi:hypothetical protein ACU8V7_15580 [Zobellia nedashkovskayae]